MTPAAQHGIRVIVSIGVTVALTSLLWPVIQGKSVTALAVAGGVATSSLIEDRIGGHELHWLAALVMAGVCGVMCFVGLRLLVP